MYKFPSLQIKAHFLPEENIKVDHFKGSFGCEWLPNTPQAPDKAVRPKRTQHGELLVLENRSFQHQPNHPLNNPKPPLESLRAATAAGAPIDGALCLLKRRDHGFRFGRRRARGYGGLNGFGQGDGVFLVWLEAIQ